MKKALFFIAFVIITNFAFSKDENTVKLYVCEFGTSTPLQRANILVKGQKKGTATNKKGFFELAISQKENLKVSHIGYTTKLIPLNSIKNYDTIFLHRKSYAISSITIKPVPKNKRHNKWIGSRSLRKNHNWLFKTGQQLAFFIENPLKKTVLVKTLSFQLRKSSKYGCDIRLRIMDRNPKTLAPQYDLTDREIFINRKLLRKKNKLSVEDYNIFLPKEGAFFVFEWIGKADKNIEMPILVGHMDKKREWKYLWHNYRDGEWKKEPKAIYEVSYAVPNFSMEVIY